MNSLPRSRSRDGRRPHWLLGQLAHALTASRLLSSPLIFVWIVTGARHLAVIAVCAAMLSDLLDGKLIRRFGTPSTAGAFFDIWADFLVIVAVFAGLGLAGSGPLWPLVPIGLSFTLFIATSRQRPTIYDPVGRYLGGILMVAALAALLVQQPLWQQGIAWVVALVCAITMLGRIAFVIPRHAGTRVSKALRQRMRR